jgi:hypothetical protein
MRGVDHVSGWPQRVFSIGLVALLCGLHGVGHAQTPETKFAVTGLAKKCLSWAAPETVNAPVFLAACQQGPGQQVGVVEIPTRPQSSKPAAAIGLLPPPRYEIVLMAGAFCIGAEAGILVNNVPLVLQPCANSPSQVFSLDGDSIVLAANRDLVAQVRDANPVEATPIVLNRRNLAPPEFWNFAAVDGSDRAPTSGFVTATSVADFCTKVSHAGYGAVIQIIPDNIFDLTNVCATPLLVPGGVTIRGGRDGVLEGPQVLLKSAPSAGATLFQINGPDVRITGLRIMGTSRSKGDGQPQTYGISSPNQFGTVIDHNDISDWTVAAVNISGPTADDNVACKGSAPPGRQLNARVVRNFIHHNEMHGLGYAVATGDDGLSSIEGNVFLQNRHAIAADGTQFDSYNAVGNLVLSTVPTYGLGGRDVEHDFDMHGAAEGTHHVGGVAGGGVLISGNTFLGTSRANFILRGTPCALNQFVGNQSVHGQNDAVQWYCAQSQGICGSGQPPAALQIQSHFGVPNPTQRIAVGDFDGDGTDDLFLATGAAWYYSPGANAEWRFLRAAPQTMDQLLFGDLDGDGRTDVLMKDGRQWLVSWGGISAWQKLSVSDGAISEFTVGRFLSRSHADIFHADGKQWTVSEGGAGPFNPFADSSLRIGDLRFGDFDGDGLTDAMGIVANQWMVVFSGKEHQWTRLNSKLSDSVSGLFVADLDGNGKADIVSIQAQAPIGQPGLRYRVSRGGTSAWTDLISLPLTRPLVAVGNFDAKRGADFLVWNGDSLDIASSGTGSLAQQSRQDMR